MYEYLILVLVLGVIWTIAYLVFGKLRRKILWSSLIALPFGVGDLYFIPNYWTPQTLFDLGIKYHVAIEGFLLMFFLGGIAGFVYEGVFKKRIPVVQKFCHPYCKCYTPLIVTLVTFIVLVKAFPNWNIIYPVIYACLASGGVAMIVYPKLRRHVVFGGIVFMFLYWFSLAVVDLFSPGWIVSTWNMATLSGITLIRVPIEEILFGFSFGVFWSPLFEETCSNLHKKR